MLTPITTAFLTEALIERSDTAGANAELAQQGLNDELPLIWPTTPLLLARGRLHTACGDHSGAVEDLLATGQRVARLGHQQPCDDGMAIQRRHLPSRHR
jgi:hypothetical protein